MFPRVDGQCTHADSKSRFRNYMSAPGGFESVAREQYGRMKAANPNDLPFMRRSHASNNVDGHYIAAMADLFRLRVRVTGMGR